MQNNDHWVLIINFSSVVEGGHLMSFQSENAIFKFGRCSTDEACHGYFSIESPDHRHLSL